jgi:hypothetical protein
VTTPARQRITAAVELLNATWCLGNKRGLNRKRFSVSSLATDFTQDLDLRRADRYSFLGNLACFVTADLADTKLRMPCDGISRGIAASGLLKGIRGNSGSLATVDRALVDILYCICVRDDGIRRVLSYGHPLHSSSGGQPDPVPVARRSLHWARFS